MIESTSGRFDRTDHALVIGLGRSGRASVEVLRSRLGSVVATDEAPPEQIADALDELRAANVRFVRPDELDEALEHVTVAVLSPGIALNNPLVRRVAAKGIPVFSEVEVAYRICAAPIVAVTGTKGKTTTTALIGALFAAAGQDRARGRQHRQRADPRDGGREGGRLGDRRGVVVPARVDPLVQAEDLADPQRDAGSSRPLPVDGRVRRSEDAHLRQPRSGRHVRGQPRRSDRRVGAGRGQQPHQDARAVVRERTAPHHHAVPARSVDRVRAADGRSAPDRDHDARARSRCWAATTWRT